MRSFLSLLIAGCGCGHSREQHLGNGHCTAVAAGSDGTTGDCACAAFRSPDLAPAISLGDTLEPEHLEPFARDLRRLAEAWLGMYQRSLCRASDTAARLTAALAAHLPLAALGHRLGFILDGGTPSTGAAAISAERSRQVGKGYDPEHDDHHTHGELARAACALLMHDASPFIGAEELWPFREPMPETLDRRALLVRAGALIAAEIDRLDRPDHATAFPEQNTL